MSKEKTNIVTEVVEYFPAAVTELKKVTFPTKDELIKVSTATLIFIGFLGLCLTVIDLIISRIMQVVL